MKNSKLKIALILTLLFSASSVSAATTASLAPDNISVNPGQTFSVSVSVNPQNTANYAEKIEVNFPADTLEVVSFSFSSNWIAMTQSGYDVVDNKNGILVKTAGYPNGISSVTSFGTISFKVKKAGSGIIKIGSNSLAFQASGKSTAITGNSVTFKTLTPPVKTPESSQPTSVSTTSVTSTSVSSDTSSEQSDTENALSNQDSDTSGQLAAVDQALTDKAGSSWSSWIWILVGLIALVIIFWVYRKIVR